MDADYFNLLANLQILLFNCMSVRDPQLLLPRLINACASHGKYQICQVYLVQDEVIDEGRCIEF